MKLAHPGNVSVLQPSCCQLCEKQQWRCRKELIQFFMLGVSFKCLAVGFTSMLYRSEVKQLFNSFSKTTFLSPTSLPLFINRRKRGRAEIHSVKTLPFVSHNTLRLLLYEDRMLPFPGILSNKYHLLFHDFKNVWTNDNLGWETSESNHLGFKLLCMCPLYLLKWYFSSHLSLLSADRSAAFKSNAVSHGVNRCWWTYLQADTFSV